MTMGFVLRQAKDEANPTAADAWGKQATAARLVYFETQNVGGVDRTAFIAFLCRGGKYGCDGLDRFEYDGQVIDEFISSVRQWRFHPGTITKQIVLKTFTADSSTDTFTANGHGYNNNDEVRVRSRGGLVSAGLTAETVKYFVVNKTTNTFQLSATSGGSAINITNAGTGTLQVWKADAGYDDPNQGRPEFFPTSKYTFSGMCYVEGLLPDTLSDGSEPTKFAFFMRGRKVADYNSSGVYLSNSFSANNARVAADILLNEAKLPSSRIHWQSWHNFKVACDILIWFRYGAQAGATGVGLTGRYYNGTNFETFVLNRVDATVDFNWGTGSPGTGVNSDSVSVRWEGQVKPQYSELYTFQTRTDDGVRLWVNNQLIIDDWTGGAVRANTGQITLTAGQLYNIKLEYFEVAGPAEVHLEWSSPSRSLEIIPTSRLFPSDSQVKRYEAHFATANAMTAFQAFEEVMYRAPGWHWQDVNGKITFLPPDRASVHHFVYDPYKDNARFNIVAGTFEATPRAMEERPNWRLYFYRDIDDEFYARKPVEADRSALREEQGGQPSNLQPIDLGVMSRSLAQRIADTDMKLFSDPERVFSFRAMMDSYHVSKADRVYLSHWSAGDTYEAFVDCLASNAASGAGAADEQGFTLLPVTFPFYTDEPVS